MFGRFEGWRLKKEPGTEERIKPAATLEELESRRDALVEWMKHDSTPDDVRILDDINRQIQDRENAHALETS
jgi:hypothetical protein